ncbi:MAG: CBS domain-containing protein [Gammaproteobacteria bacterium]|jgi:pentose-5-phosphate-3-epimerase/CBS domain-containing protein
MKISASVYSSKQSNLADIIKDLDDHHADMFHIDCNDNPDVFRDIAEIRQLSSTPVDLHIISATPSKYFEDIVRHNVDYVTFQYENLQEQLAVPDSIKSQLGLAVTSDTDIEVFAAFEDRFDFILLMATVPGKSGGEFNRQTFKKIRAFRQRFPNKRIHVDGGVNAEISFILRNMGVYASVSGSYLMAGESMGAAMLGLRKDEVESHFQVKDFMRSTDEIPLLRPVERSVASVLQSIEDHKLGFTILIDENGKLDGLITNADVRKGLLKHTDNLHALTTEDMTNTDPVRANENFSVEELLRFIKQQSFPISYLPVVDDDNKVTGAVTFFNLIKGEL